MLKVSGMSMTIKATKHKLWAVSNSTDSQNTRDRINKEMAYLDSFAFKDMNYSQLAEWAHLPNVTDALQYTEGMFTKQNLTEQEKQLLEGMKEFKLIYREKLEKQIKERDQKAPTLKQNILPSETVMLTMREVLIHNATVSVLEELLEKYWNDLSAFVIISEKLKKLKSQKSHVNYASSTRIALIYEGLNIYRNKQETTEMGRQSIQKLIEEDILLLNELRAFEKDYVETVENEIKEYSKQLIVSYSLHLTHIIGRYRNGTITYDTRDKEEVVNINVEDRINQQIQKLETLQTDVKEWEPTLFKAYEESLGRQDSNTIDKILLAVKKYTLSIAEKTQKPTSSVLETEHDELWNEERNLRYNYRTEFIPYQESRYKVDPFIFMRSLERIEKELKQLLKLTNDVKLKDIIGKTLGRIENIDYTESSLQTKEQFDAKFADAISNDKATKIVNALKLKVANQNNNTILDHNFTLREQLVFKKIEPLVQEYKQKLQKKFDNSVEGSGFEQAQDSSN